MGVLETLGNAFMQLVAFPAFLYMIIGILIGIVVGFVPGIGGMAAIALILPFTFTMTPAAGLAFLLGMHSIIQTSNTAIAVLFNIPGSMGASATLFDGHPMALKGEAGRALGAGYASSIIGGLIGATVLFFSVPIFRPLVMAFSYPDFFLLLLWGLLVAGMAGGVSLVKVLASAFLGAAFGLIGFDPLSGVPRYSLGTIYLLQGVPVLALVMGTFAIPEIMDLAVKKTAIAEDTSVKEITDVGAGIRDTFQNWFLVVRSALMGVLIGFIPGLGSYVSSYVVYGQAARTVKNPNFGKGDVRGVIAPESANNATEGGALIPTIMFGVPGSPAFVVLLGAFLIFGLQPGPSMVTRHLDLTFVMVLTLVFSNVIGGFGLLAVAKKTALITVVRSSLLIPIIASFCFMGAYMSNSHFGDLVVMIFFGIIGYGLRHLKWSLLAFMLGYIFSSEGERNLYATLNMFGFAGFFRSVVTVVLLILIFATFVFPILRALWKKIKEAGPDVSVKKSEGVAMQAFRFNSETLFALLVFGLFVAFLVLTLPLPPRARPFPLGVAAGGGITSLIICFSSFRKGVRSDQIAKSLNVDIITLKRRLITIVAWLMAYFICSWLLGVEYALPVISFLYLKFYCRESWMLSLIITAALVGLLFGVFGRILNVFWIEGKLFQLFGWI